MNIFQAYLTITRNINTNPILTHGETITLAAIAIGVNTTQQIANSLHLNFKSIQRNISNLLKKNLIIRHRKTIWPYNTHYTLTPSGETTITAIMNYKTKPQLSNHE